MEWTVNDIIGLKASIFTNGDGTSPISLALSCYGLRELLTEAMSRTCLAQPGRLGFDQMVAVRQRKYSLARGWASFRASKLSEYIAQYVFLQILKYLVDVLNLR